jgi:hypothetical protein
MALDDSNLHSLLRGYAHTVPYPVATGAVVWGLASWCLQAQALGGLLRQVDATPVD